MFDRAREMHIPFMCGSTVPLTWQRPLLNVPRGTPFTEILATSYSDLEEHAYHGIEVLQAMAERRGRETGVARVRWACGDDLWKAGEADEWSRSLLNAALERRINLPPASGSKQQPQAFLIQRARHAGRGRSRLDCILWQASRPQRSNFCSPRSRVDGIRSPELVPSRPALLLDRLARRPAAGQTSAPEFSPHRTCTPVRTRHPALLTIEPVKPYQATPPNALSQAGILPKPMKRIQG